MSGAIEYNCVWVHSRNEREDPWMCMWAMDLPGASRWSLDTRGRDVPWHRVYASAAKRGAALAFPLLALVFAAGAIFAQGVMLFAVSIDRPRVGIAAVVAVGLCILFRPRSRDFLRTLVPSVTSRRGPAVVMPDGSVGVSA